MSQRALRNLLRRALCSQPVASGPRTWKNQVASSAPLLWGRARPTCKESFSWEKPRQEAPGVVLGVPGAQTLLWAWEHSGDSEAPGGPLACSRGWAG